MSTLTPEQFLALYQNNTVQATSRLSDLSPGDYEAVLRSIQGEYGITSGYYQQLVFLIGTEKQKENCRQKVEEQTRMLLLEEQLANDRRNARLRKQRERSSQRY